MKCFVLIVYFNSAYNSLTVIKDIRNALEVNGVVFIIAAAHILVLTSKQTESSSEGELS